MPDTIRVLMIEDNPVDQKAFERFLKSGDHKIHCTNASSLQSGLEWLGKADFDAILVDYQLGDGTALDLLQMHKRHPIIVITGLGNEEIAIRAMKMGACDYLIKDIHSNYLKIIPITLENAIKRWQDQQQQKLLSHTVRSISEAVFITDKDDRVIFINHAFSTIYGYTSEQVCGKASAIIWHDSRDNLQSIECVMRRTTIEWSGKVQHVRGDGEVFPAMVSRSSVKDENGHAFAIVGIARDITEETSIEAERERLLDDIQATLERFRDLKLPLPVSRDFGTLDDIRHYWNQLSKFLLESGSGSPRKKASTPSNGSGDTGKTGRSP